METKPLLVVYSINGEISFVVMTTMSLQHSLYNVSPSLRITKEETWEVEALVLIIVEANI